MVYYVIKNFVIQSGKITLTKSTLYYYFSNTILVLFITPSHSLSLSLSVSLSHFLSLFISPYKPCYFLLHSMFFFFSSISFLAFILLKMLSSMEKPMNGKMCIFTIILWLKITSCKYSSICICKYSN